MTCKFAVNSAMSTTIVPQIFEVFAAKKNTVFIALSYVCMFSIGAAWLGCNDQ